MLLSANNKCILGTRQVVTVQELCSFEEEAHTILVLHATLIYKNSPASAIGIYSPSNVLILIFALLNDYK